MKKNFSVSLCKDGMNNISDGMLVIEKNGTIHSANKTVEEIFGITSDELIHENVYSIFSNLKTIELMENQTLTAKHEDGRDILVELSIVRDLTNEHHFICFFEEKLGESEVQLQQLKKITFDGLAIHDNGQLVEINQKWINLFGYTEEEIKEKSILQFIHEEDHAKVSELMLNNVEEKIEITGINKDGKELEFIISTGMFPIEGKTYQLMTFRNITKRKRYEEKIEYLSQRDSLTGLPNRGLLKEELNMVITWAQRNDQLIAVLDMDLNNFKQINDTLGDKNGDRVLKEVSKRLQKLVDGKGFVSRIGADEFIIVLKGVENKKDVMNMAESVIHTTEKPIEFKDTELSISASIGICLFPDHTDCQESLLKNASIAMREAKEAGAPFKFFKPEMNKNIINQFTLENELRKAIQQDELYLHYQPITDLKTGVIVGSEALLRWNHEELGFISPAEFIPVAEKSGLIIELGEWVLRTAIVQNKLWQEAGYRPISISVNLSAIQFIQQDLVDKILATLAETDLDATYLNLEITENIAMENEEAVFSKLKELQRAGVHISIDDFGTGYSSFSYLKKYTLNYLKIDKSFIKDCLYNADDQSIVKSMVFMAHSLGLKVIAEGVEELEQMNFLKMINCDYVQGYFLSKPVGASEMIELLQRENFLTLLVD
ncbi:MAG: EAL domain-containing protein [Bacillus sp. (in: Bacteria)]|nr:EAL domain-containing protein [Bacillus sp. (in: firmicutes)]